MSRYSFSEADSYAMDDHASECGGYCSVSFLGFSACSGNCPACPNFLPADFFDFHSSSGSSNTESN